MPNGPRFPQMVGGRAVQAESPRSPCQTGGQMRFSESGKPLELEPRLRTYNVGKLVGTNPELVLLGDKKRGYLLIQNRSVAPIYFAFSEKMTGGSGNDIFPNAFKMDAGGYFEWNTNIPTDDIYAVSTSANALLTIAQGLWVTS